MLSGISCSVCFIHVALASVLPFLFRMDRAVSLCVFFTLRLWEMGFAIDFDGDADTSSRDKPEVSV